MKSPRVGQATGSRAGRSERRCELTMASTSSVRPRPTRLQFSLRLLLIVFTGFAIGFPIWYRWPYQEVHEEPVRAQGACISRSVVHWQRQWGGEILLHGKREDVHKDWRGGETIITTQYVRGNRH